MATAEVQMLEILEEEDPQEKQYVSFILAEETFAFPMFLVQEIVRPPDIVAVPLSPRSFMGLANLRGNVLPVVDLRCLLGLESRKTDAATRVVVVDIGMVMGLMVDRIARVFSPREDQFEETAKIQSSIDTRLLSGIIKGDEEQGLVQLLDLDTLIKDNFTISATQEGATASSFKTPEQSPDEQIEEDLIQLISFLVADQEYAFDISVIQEIVRIPEAISQIPRAAHHIMGMIELRGRLLPIINLRKLFQIEGISGDDRGRILVISQSGGSQCIGVVVDQVREVLHVNQESMDRKPALLGQAGGLDEIEHICRLEQGQRLISVIDSKKLLHDPAVQAATLELEEREMSVETAPVQDDEDEGITQLVVFTLESQEYGVLIESVQEITRVPEEMNEVPKTPDFIEGMINLRGTVLPVVDMRTRFGLPRMEANDRQRILVLNLSGIRTGFITDSVSEVLRVHRDQIEESPSLSNDQERILGRVANLRGDKRIIQVLNVDELLDDQQTKQLLQREQGE